MDNPNVRGNRCHLYGGEHADAYSAGYDDAWLDGAFSIYHEELVSTKKELEEAESSLARLEKCAGTGNMVKLHMLTTELESTKKELERTKDELNWNLREFSSTKKELDLYKKDNKRLEDKVNRLWDDEELESTKEDRVVQHMLSNPSLIWHSSRAQKELDSIKEELETTKQELKRTNKFWEEYYR